MKKYKLSLFIFRRDLRIEDNTALNQALLCSDKVIACFIFDPRQIKAHAYQNRFALQFMLQSIQDLQQQFTKINASLNLYYGLPEIVINELTEHYQIEAVFFNRDYTPFSRQRDATINQHCHSLKIDCYHFADALLTEPEQVLKADNSPYQVFTAFYKKARTITVHLPQTLAGNQFIQTLDKPTAFCFENLLKPSPKALQAGGRKHAQALLNQQLLQLENYDDMRNFPAISGTSLLSAHLKFGTCSVREVFHHIQIHLNPEHSLLRQLYWRDFFTHLAFHFPKVFGHAFIDKYNAIQWENNPDLFNAWTNGKTGFPIVDAGMRELNTTGFMHNRVRMIVASFLVKDLHIDWRWGERYFAQHLIDYDPCINNGNWQWAASTGCDAQPYFRIFNPWLQQKKFDADCKYIYQWIPELTQFPPSLIHQWDKKYCQCDYPKPMINHKIASEQTKTMFSRLSSSF